MSLFWIFLWAPLKQIQGQGSAKTIFCFSIIYIIKKSQDSRLYNHFSKNAVSDLLQRCSELSTAWNGWNA